MTVDPSYTVTIPAAIVIPDETQTVEATVSAADVVIDPGNQLKVTIGETFSVIKQDQDLNTLDTLDFTVKIGDTVISTGGTFLKFWPAQQRARQLLRLQLLVRLNMPGITPEPLRLPFQ